MNEKATMHDSAHFKAYVKVACVSVDISLAVRYSLFGLLSKFVMFCLYITIFVQKAFTKKNVCIDNAVINTLYPRVLHTSLWELHSASPKPKNIAWITCNDENKEQRSVYEIFSLANADFVDSIEEPIHEAVEYLQEH